MVMADGKRVKRDDATVPYVGRPIMHSDLCTASVTRLERPPKAPYVWLGAAVEPGIVDLGDGCVAGDGRGRTAPR